MLEVSRAPHFFGEKELGIEKKYSFLNWINTYVTIYIYIPISGYFYTPPKFNSKFALEKDGGNWVERRSG